MDNFYNELLDDLVDKYYVISSFYSFVKLINNDENIELGRQYWLNLSNEEKSYWMLDDDFKYNLFDLHEFFVDEIGKDLSDKYYSYDYNRYCRDVFGEDDNSFIYNKTKDDLVTINI